MNRWKSVEDIVVELGLPVCASDVDAVERLLSEQIFALHPDRTGGTFANEGQSARYHSVQDALEFIRLPVANLPATVETKEIERLVEEKLLALRQSPPVTAPSRSEVLAAAKEEIRQTNRLPKLTSGILLAISGGAYSLLSAGSANPILGALGESMLIIWALRILVVLSGGAYGWVSLRERATKQLVASRVSERSVREAFRSMLSQARSNDGRFSRSDLIGSLQEWRPLSPRWIWRHYRRVKPRQIWQWAKIALVPWDAPIDEQTAEEIASFYLGRWTDRGIIKRSAFVDAEDWFDIEESVLARED